MKKISFNMDYLFMQLKQRVAMLLTTAAITTQRYE